jgi:hypothetical protein
MEVLPNEGSSAQGAMIYDRHAIAMLGQTVRGGQTGGAFTKNDDGLRGGGRHEDRERSQTPAAMASRRLVASRARGPNI